MTMFTLLIYKNQGTFEEESEVFYKDRKKPISVTLYAWDANGERKLSTLQVSYLGGEGPHSFWRRCCGVLLFGLLPRLLGNAPVGWKLRMSVGGINAPTWDYKIRDKWSVLGQSLGKKRKEGLAISLLELCGKCSYDTRPGWLQDYGNVSVRVTNDAKQAEWLVPCKAFFSLPEWEVGE